MFYLINILLLRATAPCLVPSCLPLVNSPVSLTGHCLCGGAVHRGWHRPHFSDSCVPAPKHHQGHGLSTVEKQTLEIPGHPQVSFEPAYLPIMAKASPQARHRAPCCTTNEGSSGASIMQQHLSGNSRLNSSRAESSAKGNIFGQLGARRTLAPWA